jgi:hypothetical protein
MMSIVEVPMNVRKSTASDTIMELSREKTSLAVYVGIDLARVYSNGEVTRTFRKGIWVEQPKMDFANLVKDGYPTEILGPVMALCIRLSELSKTGTIVVQKADKTISCKPFRNIKFAPSDLESLSENQLVAYAEIDGAMILTTDGRVLAISQMLMYPTWGTTSVGGMRHESANRYSTVQDCVVFVVSSDGPISIFKAGTLWTKFFSELNP